MTAVARMAVLHLRTVAPYPTQNLLVMGVIILILGHNPVRMVPAVALLLAPLIAVQPFLVADKARLETLYAVLPVPRRAVLLGHYAWALVTYCGTVAVATILAVVLGWAQHTPVDGPTLVTLLALSWVLFAVNIAIQFPLLIRFGYARINVLATLVPVGLVMGAVLRLHLSLASIQHWLPFLWPAGAAAIAVSAALVSHEPRQRRQRDDQLSVSAASR